MIPCASVLQRVRRVNIHPYGAGKFLPFINWQIRPMRYTINNIAGVRIVTWVTGIDGTSLVRDLQTMVFTGSFQNDNFGMENKPVVSGMP